MTTQCLGGVDAARNSGQDRVHLLQQFLFSTPWSDWDIEALSADASFRRYFRLSQGGQSLLLMDAPPETEDLQAYLKVDAYLLDMGLRAPEVYARDTKRGFAVIEDFGSQTYTWLLNNGVAAEPLYQLAVDVLVKLHSDGRYKSLDVSRYDSGFYEDEAALFLDWYWPARTGSQASTELRQSFFDIWKALLGRLRCKPECLVLRDYHVDNIMLVEGLSGVDSCGLLDFQDALIGSPAYDLMSLFQDARRDVSPSMSARLLNYYLEKIDTVKHEDFFYDYRVLSAHRHLKVAGIFVRLCVRDGKMSYLNYLPRVLRMLELSLSCKEMKPLSDWFDLHHPGTVMDSLEFDAEQLRESLCV